MMSSESSLLGAMPPRPMLRRSTSAPISKVISSSRKHASSVRASSRRPYQWDSVAMHVVSVGLGEEFLQLRAMLRALPQHAGPAGLVGLVVVRLAGGAVELDGLDAGVGLPLGILGVLLGEDRRRLRLGLPAGLAQHVALRIREPVPHRLVDQDRYLGRVEAGVDAVLGLLVPTEIEDAGDRPAVAV